MKSYVLYSLENGRIFAAGTSFSPGKLVQPGMGIIYGDGECNPSRSYVENGQVRAMPESPGDGYDFNYTTKQWAQNPERLWHLVRLQRDRLIAETDWRVVVAMESGQALSPEWQAYRQALRDVTVQADPLAIEWPPVPA